MHRKGDSQTTLLFVGILAIIGTIGGIWLISPKTFRSQPSKPSTPITEEVKRSAPAPPPLEDEAVTPEPPVPPTATSGIDPVTGQVLGPVEIRSPPTSQPQTNQPSEADNSSTGHSPKPGHEFVQLGAYTIERPIEPVKHEPFDFTVVQKPADPNRRSAALPKPVLDAFNSGKEPDAVKIDESDISKALLAAAPLDLGAGKSHPPRVWTSSDGARSFRGSIRGADHVSEQVLIKRPGKKAITASWDKFSDKDRKYLEAYCMDLVEARRFKEFQDRLVVKNRQRNRAVNQAKASARYARNLAVSTANMANAVHDYKYQYNPIYRAGHETAANRRAYVLRGYAIGAGYRLAGRIWVPGRQSVDGTWISGYWK